MWRVAVVKLVSPKMGEPTSACRIRDVDIWSGLKLPDRPGVCLRRNARNLLWNFLKVGRKKKKVQTISI